MSQFTHLQISGKLLQLSQSNLVVLYIDGQPMEFFELLVIHNGVSSALGLHLKTFKLSFSLSQPRHDIVVLSHPNKC